MLLALLLLTRAALAQFGSPPGDYVLTGEDAHLAGQTIYLLPAERVSHAQALLPLDSAQADEAGRFTLRGRVPAPDVYRLRLGRQRGKCVLVDFWASWCAPCRAANPAVLAAYQRFQARGGSFTVLSVSLDEQPVAWRQAVAQDALPWAQVVDVRGMRGPTGQLYQLPGIPATYLLDPQGYIVATQLSGPALTRELNRLLQ